MSDVNEEDLDAIENEPDPADESADEEASGDTGEESSGDTGEESSGDKGEDKDKDKEEPAANWRDAIKDEKLRKQAERYNTPEDAVKNILNLRQQLSKSITKPGKDSDEVEVASFRKQMGIPETPDGYHFPPPASERKVEGSSSRKQRPERCSRNHRKGLPRRRRKYGQSGKESRR
jgi:hypothetical protein